MNGAAAETEVALFLRRLQRGVLAAFGLWVVWLLAPILTPFVVALMLAWLGDPLVDRLEARGRSRNTAVILVFAMMILLLALA
ncbi:MAG TPA: AI-2E family transporter, partial [Stenotrophomonas sp.]|nr:AI-2E family transporter [Stenotrophomonas sp.]